MSIDQAAPDTRTARGPGLPLAALIPVAGLAWWLVGFLPWVVEVPSRWRRHWWSSACARSPA